ncbi:aminotransferase class V-fold PLP-dependent enzyme [Clostridium peptidivorans]|uniref:aminotransferase class V-fold PLP-dependent enzyme n=1 Tax=Clostridium peptidivorans TaxID=100174 RepID=UPI000BE3E5F8|nr:aminotransferase class V-fold PLP-dependent enzyme [Clostridium peptidivorans]
MSIYLDNAATTFPKPNEVTDSMIKYMTEIGGNPGRGAYKNSIKSSEIVFDCRLKLAELFNFDKLENVVFTPNITTSLNTLLKSSIKDGWHIITTSMEHNSILRPLASMEKSKNIQVDIINCDENGVIDIDILKESIRENTKLIILSHASNVVGSIQPIKEIGDICKEKNIYFIIDSAQTAGNLYLDFKNLNCSALAFTGHKSLLGPQGIGGFLLTDEFNAEMTPFIEGGTGSESYNTEQPNFLPDKFESGTLNMPGIVGLLSSLKFIENFGLRNIQNTEQSLFKIFIEELSNMNDISIIGYNSNLKYVPTISITSSKVDVSELGMLLERDFGIMTRTGLHCAPLAHKTIGTFPTGTLRFSLGLFNTKEHIDYTINSLYKLLKRE